MTPARRHVVLVGLPGSGKSTAGRAAARLLGAPFTDLDTMIEGEAGAPVADLFARHGEAEFRRLERDAMRRALESPPQLLAPGGGWAAQPGNLEAARDRSVVVYLAVSPNLAARRLEGDTGRPLLAGGDLVTRLAGLLAEREAAYRQAPIEIDAGREVDLVAAAVAAAARRFAGW